MAEPGRGTTPEQDCRHGCNGDCVVSGSDDCTFTCHPADEGRVATSSGCSYYLDSDRYCGRRVGGWRPANIPMAPFEWFCKQHATRIAQREGVYGIYSVNDRSKVEEVPDLTPPASTTPSD